MLFKLNENFVWTTLVCRFWSRLWYIYVCIYIYTVYILQPSSNQQRILCKLHMYILICQAIVYAYTVRARSCTPTHTPPGQNKDKSVPYSTVLMCIQHGHTIQYDCQTGAIAYLLYGFRKLTIAYLIDSFTSFIQHKLIFLFKKGVWCGVHDAPLSRSPEI